MKQKTIFGFPQNVFILSFISFLNDIGGQTIKYAIPLFLSNALGVKTSIIGLVEGIGEATPTLFQPLSGILSDKLKKRKPLVVFGQIIRSSIIFLFFATSWWIVLILRFLDRTGKGIQGAPRDALLSASAEEGKQGKAFGLSRMFDNAGAVVGLILAGLIALLATGNALKLSTVTFHFIVLLAVIPTLIAFFLLFKFLNEVDVKKDTKKISFEDHLGKKYYIFLCIIFIFTLGNSSDAFLILKAQNTGLDLASIFFLLAVFSLIASVTSLPIGIFSDKIGRKKLIISGWILYFLVYLGFAKSTSSISVIFLFLAYGVYYGLTEGVAKAYIADIVPKNKKGSAFGWYNLVVGSTLFPASLIAGYLWQVFSPATSFYFGASLAIIAALGFIIFN